MKEKMNWISSWFYNNEGSGFEPKTEGQAKTELGLKVGSNQPANQKLLQDICEKGSDKTYLKPVTQTKPKPQTPKELLLNELQHKPKLKKYIDSLSMLA